MDNVFRQMYQQFSTIICFISLNVDLKCISLDNLHSLTPKNDALANWTHHKSHNPEA